MQFFCQNEQEEKLVTAKSRLEVEKSELAELLDKRNREIDRLSGQLVVDVLLWLCAMQDSATVFLISYIFNC